MGYMGRCRGRRVFSLPGVRGRGRYGALGGQEVTCKQDPRDPCR